MFNICCDKIASSSLTIYIIAQYNQYCKLVYCIASINKIPECLECRLISFNITFDINNQIVADMMHPIIKWAQRKDRVFIEVQLRDIADQKITLTPTTIAFSGISDKVNYSFDFELFAQINTQQSKWTKTGFHLLVVLQKKDTDKPFWPRITKDTKKNQYIQIDWAKWVDQDEEKEEGDKGLGGFDPSQMQGFPGMGGMGGFPGMGGGMGGMGKDEDEDDEQEQGNIDDLDKEEEVQEKSSA